MDSTPVSLLYFQNAVSASASYSTSPEHSAKVRPSVISACSMRRSAIRRLMPVGASLGFSSAMSVGLGQIQFGEEFVDGFVVAGDVAFTQIDQPRLEPSQRRRVGRQERPGA